MRTSILVSACTLAICASLFLACGDDGASSTTTDELTFTDEDGNTVEIEIKAGSFKDSRDGQKYSTVTVDGVTWMTENLRYATQYSYDAIDLGAKRDYGRLYSSGEAHKVCPEDWHLPTETEWRHLFLALEKVYGDSVAWALKSTSGWKSTEDGQSGNGSDAIGFSAEPGGKRDDGYEEEGEYVAYWKYSYRNNRLYNDAAQFEYDETDWCFQSYAYSGVSLYVRCVNNTNTVFENLGICSSASEGKVAAHNGDYLTCRDTVWEISTREDILDFEFGPCDSTRSDSVHVLNDSAFTCRTKTALMYNRDLDEWQTIISGEWDIATQEEALGECSDANIKQLKKYKGEDYACYKVMTDWYDWRIATADDVLPNCDSTKLRKVNYFKDTAYICKKNYNYFNWVRATEEEETRSKLSECTDAKKGEVVTTKIGKYVCVNKYWRPLNIVEYTLGICKSNGATGVFDGYTFTCDAKHLLWKATLSGDTALVAVDSALWMTQDSYSGKYVFSPMIHGGSPCPSGFSITSSKDWEKLYENLDANLQLKELITADSASYYGLNLYNPYEWGQEEAYFLQDSKVCPYVEYGEDTHCLVDTKEITPSYYLMDGSAWVCSARESNNFAGICSSGYAAARCIKDYSAPEAEEE